MNRIFYSLALLFCASHIFAADIIFSGKIIDAQTKQPLPGASITIQDLKISATADLNGNFKFNRIPDNGKFLVQVSFLGYKYLNKTINFSTTQSFVFELEESKIEASEVIVTGTVTGTDSKKNSTSVGVLSHDEMLNLPSTNLIDAVSKVAGVTQISTGQAISKPVIRGLSFNRIVTVNDGVKQQGQQWGDEHGVEIDQFSAYRVEVLRGAASLLYGADALGGVINILEPLTVSDGVIKAEVITDYSTNGGLSSNSAMLTGNTTGFVWRGRATYKNAYSFKTPDYYFPNSGFNETSLSAMLGLNKAWGYSHINISSFTNNIGFYDPVLDANNNFIDEDGNTFSKSDLTSRDLAFPKQQINHFKIASNSNILMNSGSVKLDLGYQNNIRKEFETTDPSLFFDLKSYSLDAKYIQNASLNDWQPIIGLSADYQKSLNKGNEFLVPNYANWGLGLFYYVRKDFDKSSFNFGLRYDYRKNTGKTLFDEGVEKFSAFNTHFSNISGAVGFTHQLGDKLNIKANISSGFRAPNPAEQSSNGVHEGTFRYELGDNNLKSEKSYQADINLQYSVSIFDFSVSIYNNYMKDYIYLAQKNNETIIADDDATTAIYPLFRYQQDDANFYGSDASLIFHPFDFLHFENIFSYVHAQNLGLKEAVPFIPATSLKNEIRVEPKNKGSKGTYFSVGIETNFAQNRIASFETKTAAYTLLQAGIGTHLTFGKQLVRLNISGNNLLDKHYYNHLSRYKPGRLDESNPNFGIFNPGRNITFGLYIPLNIR